MNTPAHVLLAVAMAGKPDARGRNTALVAGALFPDITMFFMVGWERWINGLSLDAIFRDAYFSAFWQEVFAVNNSAPVFALMLVVGLALRVDWLWAFGLAALTHALLDLPLHNDDGHPHFWPFTDWIYSSPVSYWDPDHYGVQAGWVEAGISVVLAVILLRRFIGIPARLAIVAGLAIELIFSVGGHFIYGEG
jgi:hypothetical protein